MGQLVFQATLGGQVNLVGPNTASTFNINVPATTGTMVTTGDSGTVTSTMLATSVYTAPGTIGSGTANTGAFTSLSYTTTLTGGTGIIAIGTNQIYKDASGNVGIGTSSPATKLHLLTPSATAVALRTGNSISYAEFQVDASGNSQLIAPGGVQIFNTNGSERMRIDSSGNVGIGTSSPGYRVDIQGTTATQRISSTTGTNAAYQLFSNTGQNFYVGLDNSAGNQILSAAYGATLLGSGAYPMVFGTNNTERMRIDSSGNLLVGTTSTSVTSGGYNFLINDGGTGYSTGYIGHITGCPSGYAYLNFKYAGTTIGTITQNGTTAVAYNTSSDYRLKHDIAPMTGALAKVAALKPVTYKWNTDDSDGEGFIAHELAEVCPHAVTGAKDAVDENGNPVYQGIDTSFLVATLTAAIQELKALTDAQANTITALTARIEALENKT